VRIFFCRGGIKNQNEVWRWGNCSTTWAQALWVKICVGNPIALEPGSLLPSSTVVPHKVGKFSHLSFGMLYHHLHRITLYLPVLMDGILCTFKCAGIMEHTHISRAFHFVSFIGYIHISLPSIVHLLWNICMEP
jgi:hypothetical protein